VWATRLPAAEQNLRQGDLLLDVPFPERHSITLTDEGLQAAVRPSAVLVISHCCTIEQRRSVTLARIVSNAAMPDDHPFLRALRNVDPNVGDEYTHYSHLLAPHPSLPTRPKKVRIVELTDTVTVTAPNIGGCRSAGSRA
jgi:hypothetical protein